MKYAARVCAPRFSRRIITMKVLFVHPDDSPLDGPWRSVRWDYIVDLGWSGPHVYAQWGAEMGCPVRALYGFSQEAGVLEIRNFLAAGLGQIVDSEGIDWWEIWAPVRYLQIFELLLIIRLSQEITGAELAATRPHRLLPFISKVFDRDVHCFNPNRPSIWRDRLRRFVKAASILSPAQIVDISFDKWDPDYRLRARFSRRGSTSRAARVLLPSAYVNVSRVLNAYASLLPERDFLMVATRRNGALAGFNRNVSVAKLASYAATVLSDSTRREIHELQLTWKKLSSEGIPVGDGMHLAIELGIFDDFSSNLEQGLRIRDAWRNVFASENICAVGCGDENVPTTRVPVLLARRRGIPTFYFEHGALNALLPLRALACDTYVAKGEMEQDYMIQHCAVPASRILVGAPSGRQSGRQGEDGSSIVFFSEQYELSSGRTQSFYREVLPRLCALARQCGRRVIVKLHPFESPRLRTRIIGNTVSREDRKLIDIVHGPITPELMQRAWCALTLESSVAVECAMNGVPCFLCGWFEISFAGYAKQYIKFGAARRLESPEEIASIPDLLRHYSITPDVQERLWHPISPQTLDEMLFPSAGAAASAEGRKPVGAANVASH